MEELIAWLGGEDAIVHAVSVGALVAARVAPLSVLAPWLALRAAPAVVRTAVILALTVSFTPMTIDATQSVPSGAWAMTLALLREALGGAVFAIAIALPFHGLDWAGRLIDTWRGASMSEVIAPPTGERTSPIGDLQLMLGVALFLVFGGHRLAFEAFAEGLVIAPVGVATIGDFGAIALGSAKLVAAALAFGVSIAAPAAAAIVMVELGLGLVARSAPQVPVFFAGMPLRAAIGIAATLLALALVVDRLPAAFRQAIAAARDLMVALAG